jgi:hypothetical protein
MERRLPGVATPLDANTKALFQGASMMVGEVTLTPGSTTTVVNFRGVSAKSHIDLEPTNAAMATEWATTRPYVSAKDTDQFTITHANNATVRTISFAVRNPRRA